LLKKLESAYVRQTKNDKKRDNMNKLIIFSLNIVCFTTGLFAQGVNSKVAEANKLFEEQKYDEANTKYRDALVDHPESEILHFNIGDVQYKKEQL